MMNGISSCGKALAIWRPAVYSEQGPKLNMIDKVCLVARGFFAAVLITIMLFKTIISGSHLPNNSIVVLANSIMVLAAATFGIALCTFEFIRSKKCIEQRFELGLQQEKVPQAIFDVLAEQPRSVLVLKSIIDIRTKRSDCGLTFLETVLTKGSDQEPLVASSVRGLTFFMYCMYNNKLTPTEFLLALERSSELAGEALKDNQVDLASFTESQKQQCRAYAVTPALRSEFIRNQIITI